MFETALVESAGLLRTTNRKPAMISVVAQFLVVAAIVAFPLLHPERIVTRHFDIAHAIPMLAPPIPVPQPPVHVRVLPTAQPTATPSMPTAPRPPRIPSTATAIDTPPSAPLAMTTGIPTGTALPIGPASSSPSIHVSSNPTGSASAHTGAGNSSTARPTNISTGVSAGLLVDPIRPVYPAIARMAHVSGTVLVEAIISPTGRIESARATGGPVMLQQAALEAVRMARYRPFLLNGQPTEVSATFSINFTLNQ